MNKIYTGIVAMVAMIAIVSGSAYALFSSQVEINGITLGTDTSGLLVSLGLENSFGTVRTMDPNFQLNKLSPGETSNPGLATFRNNGDVALNLKIQITAAGGAWAQLSPVLEGITCTDAGLVTPGDPINSVCDPTDSAESTGWANLAYWNANQVPMPGGPLAAGQDRPYYSYYRLPVSADNSVADLDITNLVLTITGTQVSPP